MNTDIEIEMLRRIKLDHLEPDKLICHLGWYRRQQQSKIINQRDMLLEACKRDSTLANQAISRTPPGPLRNELTEINILRLQAIAKVKE